MSRARKIFIACVVFFAIGLGYASYDISRRTTFPGSKPQLKERLKKVYFERDSAAGDSLARLTLQKLDFSDIFIAQTVVLTTISLIFMPD